MRRPDRLFASLIGASGLALLFTFPNLACSSSGTTAIAPAAATAPAGPGTASAASSTPASHRPSTAAHRNAHRAHAAHLKTGDCVPSFSDHHRVTCRPGTELVVAVVSPQPGPTGDSDACRAKSSAFADTFGLAVEVNGRVLCLIGYRKATQTPAASAPSNGTSSTYYTPGPDNSKKAPPPPQTTTDGAVKNGSCIWPAVGYNTPEPCRSGALKVAAILKPPAFDGNDIASCIQASHEYASTTALRKAIRVNSDTVLLCLIYVA